MKKELDFWAVVPQMSAIVGVVNLSVDSKHQGRIHAKKKTQHNSQKHTCVNTLYLLRQTN